jgi:hypothetical protein
VIDTAQNVAYLVSNQYVSGKSGPIAWYMHAIKLDSGEEVAPFPVEIKGNARNLPGVTFEPTQALQRPALLMMDGVVYAGFGSHCDNQPYEGWIAGVSIAGAPGAGALKTLWATSAHGDSIWQAGDGLISDGPGQIIFSTGNAFTSEPETWDPPKGTTGKQKPPPEGHLGESVVRVEVQAGGELQTTDYFSPFNDAALDVGDLDLGSSAPIALPAPYFGTPSVPHLLVQSGKEGYVYLLNRDGLGGRGETADNVLQRVEPAFGGVWDGAAVWPGEGGYVYIPTVSAPADTSEKGGHFGFFKYAVKEGRPELSLAGESADIFAFGSGSPIVTSNQVQSGSAILWTTWCPTSPGSCHEAKLRAYSPVPRENRELQILRELPIGQASKFSRPLASGGHLYVGNREGDLIAFAGPQLSSSSAALNLGEAPAGVPLNGEVSLTNTGSGALTIKALHRPATPFTASGLPAEGASGTLKQGETATVQVSFVSSSPGSFTDSLRLESEAGETVIPVSASVPSPEAPPFAEAPGSGPTATTATLLTPVAPVLQAGGVEAQISQLSLRPPIPPRRRARVAFTLSAAATVELAVYRRAVIRGCRRAGRACVRYVPTGIRLRVGGRLHGNVLGLDLGRLPAGLYRLAARPLTPSGTPGRTSYLYFRAAGQPRKG